MRVVRGWPGSGTLSGLAEGPTPTFDMYLSIQVVVFPEISCKRRTVVQHERALGRCVVSARESEFLTPRAREEINGVA